MTWYYKNRVIENIEQTPTEAMGFVYQITNLKTGKKYIGKKLLYGHKYSVKTITRKDGTKVKRRTKIKIESDWKEYWSSSLPLHEEIDKYGQDQFRREILLFCPSKGSVNYYEAKLQFIDEVLENDSYTNGIIQCRINKKHWKPYIEFD